MPFEKGKPKTGGRTKGTPNTTNRDLREMVRHIVESNADQILKDLSTLKPRERIAAWTKLAEFVLPKLTYTEMSAEISAGDSMKGSFVIEVPAYVDENGEPIE